MNETLLAASAGAWWNVHTHRSEGGSPFAIIDCQCGDGALPDAPFLSAGLHPWYLTAESVDRQLQWLSDASADSRVVAIGEAGLDKVRNEASFELQLHAFRQVARLASVRELPLIVHAVKSANEIISLKQELHPRNPWIIHGFRGKKELAQSYLHHGCYLSFGERFQSDALRSVPADRLLVETDTSPLPIETIYRRVAEMRDVSVEVLRISVQRNINELFFRR